MAFTSTDPFPYKHEPFSHQREFMRRAAPRPFFANHMQQGTGKSKVTIDWWAYKYLYHPGQMNGVLLVAPNGVHTNWAREQIPEHMSEAVGYRVLLWRSDRTGTKAFLEDFKRLLAFPGLAIFVMNIDAFVTKKGKAAAKRFLQVRKATMDIDEAADIRNAGSSRTISVRAIGKYAIFRHTISGLPDPEGPMDLYPQMQFLSPEILKCGSSIAFKHTYAEWRTVPPLTLSPAQKRAVEMPIIDRKTGRPKYKNLDKLNALIAPHSMRVLRQDVLDLPEQIYTKRYFDLSPEQERMYIEMENDYETELGGEVASVKLAITRDLRLQQIASGYIPVDPNPDNPDGDYLEPERVIPGGNPRLEAVIAALREGGWPKAIIWARYKYDIKLIMDALKAEGISCVRYVGGMSVDEQDANKIAFQKGDARVFVGNARAGGRGLTLTAAEVVAYYTNYWGLDPRMQSEDRAHRIGTVRNVLYIDFIGQIRGGHDTCDEKIVRALRSKQSVSEAILNDPAKRWI